MKAGSGRSRWSEESGPELENGRAAPQNHTDILCLWSLWTVGLDNLRALTGVEVLCKKNICKFQIDEMPNSSNHEKKSWNQSLCRSQMILCLGHIPVVPAENKLSLVSGHPLCQPTATENYLDVTSFFLITIAVMQHSRLVLVSRPPLHGLSHTLWSWFCLGL